MKYGKRLTKYAPFYLIILPLTLLFCQRTWASPLPLSDTGQTSCYNNTVEITCPQPGEAFYGQDGSYLINPPSYTKLDASGNDLPDSAASWVMVRDNVTGLIWEVKTDDGSVHDKDNQYTWYDSNSATNGGDAGTPGDGTDTEDFIDALNTESFGGHSDWRLPTIKELGSIVNLGTTYPAIDTVYFPNTVSSRYWSSTTVAGSTYYAWYMNFYVDSVHFDYKTYPNYVRCVRAGPSGSLDHLTLNGDGTVTDTATGLMWQQEGPGTKYTWEEALTYAENLVLAEYDDWRLPNAKELQSIVDYSEYGQAINTDYFPDCRSSDYWSSSPYANHSYYAWFVDFHNGFVLNYNKTTPNYIRCVRAGPSGSLDHLIISTAGSGGMIAPNGEVTVAAGANQTFTITPDAGYHVLDVLVDGNTVGTVLTYEFENVQANHTITASFANAKGVFTVDIKANGNDGPITVPPGDSVSITISLVAGDKAGQNADWWVAASTPFDPPEHWYSYVYPAEWMPGVNKRAQAGLFDLAPFEVLNMVLPLGAYTFYFALDDPDGAATGPWWGLDSVEVTVQ